MKKESNISALATYLHVTLARSYNLNQNFEEENIKDCGMPGTVGALYSLCLKLFKALSALLNKWMFPDEDFLFQAFLGQSEK